MEATLKQRRIGALSIIAALALVCAFWLIAPRTPLYKNYKQDNKLKDILGGIKPPAAVSGGGITILRPSSGPIAMAFYFTKLESEPVKSHYQNEFARHGFVYKSETTSKDFRTSLTFCTPGYVAILNLPKNDEDPRFYAVILSPDGAAC